MGGEYPKSKKASEHLFMLRYTILVGYYCPPNRVSDGSRVWELIDQIEGTIFFLISIFHLA